MTFNEFIDWIKKPDSKYEGIKIIIGGEGAGGGGTMLVTKKDFEVVGFTHDTAFMASKTPIGHIVSRRLSDIIGMEECHLSYLDDREEQ